MNTLRLLFQQEAESRLLLTVSRFLASIFFLLLLALPTFAQEVEPTVELGEVEVKADRIIHKTDGLLLYPSEQQKASSRSGYSLLQQLTLPNIRVDEVAHSISAIDQRGGVQIRINVSSRRSWKPPRPKRKRHSWQRSVLFWAVAN